MGGKVYRMTLKPGDAGIADTIAFMVHFKNKYKSFPEVIQDLKNEKLLDSNNISQVIDDIFKWFVANYKYVPDPVDIELIRSPKYTIIGKERYGDCDDLSTALATYLEAVGIETKYRTVAWKKETGNNFTHVYVLAKDKSGWIPLDPTAGTGGLRSEVKYHRKKDW